MSEVPLYIILPRARRGYVILDEGHKIRNPDAEVTQVSLHPKPYTRLSDPQTLYLSSTQTLHPYPDLLNPKPYTCLEPKPYTLTQTVRPENRNPSRKKNQRKPDPLHPIAGSEAVEYAAPSDLVGSSHSEQAPRTLVNPLPLHRSTPTPKPYHPSPKPDP